MTATALPDQSCDYCSAPANVFDRRTGEALCDDCNVRGPAPPEQDHPHDGWDAYRARLVGGF